LAELPASPWQAAHMFGSAAPAAVEKKNATASAVAFAEANLTSPC
jgi:hypothetical protein